MRTRPCYVPGILLFAASFSSNAIAQDEPQLTCFADNSVIGVAATTTVRAYSILESEKLAWSTSGGDIDASSGRAVTWTAPELGRFIVAVQGPGSADDALTCEVEIVVSGRTSAPSEDTAYLFLEQSTLEAPDYAVYSYVLFWDPVSELNRAAYTDFMKAFFSTIPELAKVSRSFFPEDLNITYVPVDKPAPAKPDAEWAVENYDIGRSRRILSWLGSEYEDEGPYIVSFAGGPATEYLSGEAVSQDFSQTFAHLRVPLIKAYVNQMTQEHDWGETTMRQMLLRLRNTASHFAEGVVVAREEVARWIRWKNLAE